MDSKFIVLLPFLILTSYDPLAHAITLTYNLKVRRTFNVEHILKQQKPRLLVSALPIYYRRTSHIVDQALDVNTCESRHVFGSLFNIRYVPSKHLWAEVTTGLERDDGEYNGKPTFENSATGLDDIVFAAGYRAFPTERMQVVAYGLIGVPVKTDITKCDRFGPFVGSRIFTLGIGAEASYSLLDTEQRTVAAIVQGRILHGLERSWEPILPEGGQIQPGNISDLLVAAQYREGLTVLEAGYNATFFSHQALLLPLQTIRSKHFYRNSWYGTITRANLESFFKKPFVYGIGANVSNAHKFDAKTVTGWAFFTFVF